MLFFHNYIPHHRGFQSLLVSCNKHVYTQYRPITHAISKIEPFFLSLENGSFLDEEILINSRITSPRSLRLLSLTLMYFQLEGKHCDLFVPQLQRATTWRRGRENFDDLPFFFFFSPFLPFFFIGNCKWFGNCWDFIVDTLAFFCFFVFLSWTGLEIKKVLNILLKILMIFGNGDNFWNGSNL